MTTPGDDLPSSGAVSSGAVRSSVSGASDSASLAHKHVSPHIGQIDSCKYWRKVEELGILVSGTSTIGWEVHVYTCIVQLWSRDEQFR